MLLTTIQCKPEDSSDPRPYPYHISPTGVIQQKGFWKGRLSQLIGFQVHADRAQVNIRWDEFYNLPEETGDLTIQGTYPVIADEEGSVFSLPTPVDSVYRREFTTEQLNFLNEGA